MDVEAGSGGGGLRATGVEMCIDEILMTCFGSALWSLESQHYTFITWRINTTESVYEYQ